MKEHYTLDNGWIVEKTNNQEPILYVIPIPDTFFDRPKTIKITEAIYNDVKAGKKEVKYLAKKHNLYKIIIEQNAEVINLAPKKTVNTQTKYRGSDFFGTEENGKYFLKYRLSTQGDGERKFEINKEIYKDARTGKYHTSDLFKKYNLYQFDIPENDVK